MAIILKINKLDTVFNYIESHPGLLQCQIATGLGYRYSRSIHTQIITLKKRNQIIWENEGYHVLPEDQWINYSKSAANRTTRLTDFGKRKILSKVKFQPTPRSKILKELKSDFSHHQIKKELDRLVISETIVKIKSDFGDQRSVFYYLPKPKAEALN